MFFGNITTYGPQFLGFVEQEVRAEREPQIWATVETHLCEPDIAEAEQRLCNMGCRSFWSAARAAPRQDAEVKAEQLEVSGIEEPGTRARGKGGTALFVDKGIECFHADALIGQTGAPSVGVGDDFTPLVVKRGNLECMIIVLYMTAGDGFGGANSRKLEKVAGWVMTHRLPWIVIADWNLQASEVRQSEWCKRLEGTVIEPGVATCSQGQARTLDFAVCCSAMRRNVTSLVADFQVPWRPHAALRIRLSIPDAIGQSPFVNPRRRSLRRSGRKIWTTAPQQRAALAETASSMHGAGTDAERSPQARPSQKRQGEVRISRVPRWRTWHARMVLNDLASALARGAQLQRSSMPQEMKVSKMRKAS